MILTLVTIFIVLLLALWISAMLLWWRSEQEKPIKTVKQRDVIHAWNKAARLARRSWYGGMRYSKQVTLWGNKKLRSALVTLFPKAKPAFVQQNMLTGLEHGPSSYFLAHLSKKEIAKKARKPRITVTRKAKKVSETEAVPEEEHQLSE